MARVLLLGRFWYNGRGLPCEIEHLTAAIHPLEGYMAHQHYEHGLSRRGFVTGMVAILGSIMAAIVGIPLIGYLISPALKKIASDEWVPLGTLDDIPLNTPTLFSFTRSVQVGWERTASNYGVYVVRKSAGTIDIFSNVCTHLSCRVSWVEEDAQFVCPCHDGRFEMDGSIASGPVPRPMDRYEHKVENGTLFVHIVEA
jgi:menaquinol-cytochrome c reductase iron-sulfur subunit